MTTEKVGGNIVFEKFDLDSEELVVAKKVVGKYAEKIKNFAEYDEIKLEMKSHSKDKKKHFELKGQVLLEAGKITSQSEGRNPFVLIDEVMGNILQEIEHKTKKK